MISGPAAQLGSVRRRRHVRLAAVATAALCVSAAGSAAAGVLVKHRSQVANTITVYAFQEGSLIVVPGTTPNALSQGDEQIVNDQLTATHAGKGGYPIIGHDAGTCTFSRIFNAREGLANCVVTAVLRWLPTERRPHRSSVRMLPCARRAGRSRPRSRALLCAPRWTLARTRRAGKPGKRSGILRIWRLVISPAHNELEV
jgi:hypothetical protein